MDLVGAANNVLLGNGQCKALNVNLNLLNLVYFLWYLAFYKWRPYACVCERAAIQLPIFSPSRIACLIAHVSYQAEDYSHPNTVDLMTSDIVEVMIFLATIANDLNLTFFIRGWIIAMHSNG